MTPLVTYVPGRNCYLCARNIPFLTSLNPGQLASHCNPGLHAITPSAYVMGPLIHVKLLSRMGTISVKVSETTLSLRATVAGESECPRQLLGGIQVLVSVFLQPGPQGYILFLGQLITHG